jgi:hypothetical protein
MGRYRISGLYRFTFDEAREVLSVSVKPEGKWPLFGQSVDAWKLLWKKN